MSHRKLILPEQNPPATPVIVHARAEGPADDPAHRCDRPPARPAVFCRRASLCVLGDYAGRVIML